MSLVLFIIKFRISFVLNIHLSPLLASKGFMSLCHCSLAAAALNHSRRSVTRISSFFFFGGIHFQNPGKNSEHYTCRPRFLSNCVITAWFNSGMCIKYDIGDLVTSLRRTGEKMLMPYPMKQRARIGKFCFCLLCRSNVVRVPFIHEFWVLSNLIPCVEL